MNPQRLRLLLALLLAFGAASACTGSGGASATTGGAGGSTGTVHKSDAGNEGGSYGKGSGW